MRALLNRPYPAEDGVKLVADVYLPDGPGPFPVICCRTPYDKVGHLADKAPRFVERGYAFVATDCRGRFESEGHFTRPFEESLDGKATVAWIADQRWCDGNIGLWGRSYGGVFQVPAAIHQHPALKAIAPSIIVARWFPEWCRYDGAFALCNPLWWAMGNASSRVRPSNVHVSFEKLHKLKTLDEIEEAVGFPIPALRNWADRDQEDDYWRRLDQTPMHERITVPGMHGGGWFDHVSRGQFEGYRNITDRGASEAARRGQRLLIGPWGHISFLQEGDSHRRYGEWDFGPSADYSVLRHELRFFDLHLRGIDDGFSDEPPVRLFLMGENRWLDLPDWPVPGAEVQAWRLSSGGDAHGLRGDGVLSRDSPGAEASDLIVHDPDNPCPTCGGNIFWNMEPKGPRDQRWLLERDDVLLYRSAPMTEPLRVIGPIDLDLTIASDVDDTDIVAKLCVEQPDGAVTVIVVGSFRCRYRHGFDQRVPLERDTPTRIRVNLTNVAYSFLPGTRIALMLSSSDFPRIQPHNGTMAKPFEPAPSLIARNRILTGGAHEAVLHLPVVEDV